MLPSQSLHARLLAGSKSKPADAKGTSCAPRAGRILGALLRAVQAYIQVSGARKEPPQSAKVHHALDNTLTCALDDAHLRIQHVT